jgi:hypothetical protein
MDSLLDANGQSHAPAGFTPEKYLIREWVELKTVLTGNRTPAIQAATSDRAEFL